MIMVGAGIAAKMPFKVHPHMLRHATGYALANRGTQILFYQKIDVRFTPESRHAVAALAKNELAQW